MSLKGTQPGTNRPKALADMSNEELQPWFAERLSTCREHGDCPCMIPEILEALTVADRINARDAAFLRGLLASFTTPQET